MILCLLMIGQGRVLIYIITQDKAREIRRWYRKKSTYYQTRAILSEITLRSVQPQALLSLSVRATSPKPIPRLW
jgi:hypothetical protein